MVVGSCLLWPAELCLGLADRYLGGQGLWGLGLLCLRLSVS